LLNILTKWIGHKLYQLTRGLSTNIYAVAKQQKVHSRKMK